MKLIPLTLALFALCALLPAQTAFLKPFTVDSFVYRSATQSWTYAEPLPKHPIPHFKLESLGQLECPICKDASANRTRSTIDPFGAKATLSFWHDRVQFSASAGGTEWWRQDGFSPISNALSGTDAAKLKSSESSFRRAAQHPIMNDQYNDQWLLQSHLSARVFLDSGKDVSIGVTKAYFYNNLNPMGARNWTSTTVDSTITFNDIRSVHEFFRKKQRPSP